jgi:hypothetical protein
MHRQRTGLGMVRKGERKKLVRRLGDRFPTGKLREGEKARENTTRRGLHKAMVDAGEHTEALYR